MKSVVIRFNGGPADTQTRLIEPGEPHPQQIGFPFCGWLYWYNVAGNDAFYSGESERNPLSIKEFLTRYFNEER